MPYCVLVVDKAMLSAFVMAAHAVGILGPTLRKTTPSISLKATVFHKCCLLSFQRNCPLNDAPSLVYCHKLHNMTVFFIIFLADKCAFDKPLLLPSKDQMMCDIVLYLFKLYMA